MPLLPLLGFVWHPRPSCPSSWTPSLSCSGSVPCQIDPHMVTLLPQSGLHIPHWATSPFGSHPHAACTLTCDARPMLIWMPSLSYLHSCTSLQATSPCGHPHFPALTPHCPFISLMLPGLCHPNQITPTHLHLTTFGFQQPPLHLAVYLISDKPWLSLSGPTWLFLSWQIPTVNCAVPSDWIV